MCLLRADCCTSNVHQGWPYFVLGQVHTTPNGTIVISGYSPTTTTIPAAAGAGVSAGTGAGGAGAAVESGNGDEVVAATVVKVTGNYPFSVSALACCPV